ncbi:Gp37 family protein [Pseudomonas sp. SLFW]|uniref:Gp37 family protein n=1 Tax=Pseudomonas sp. SLFW TaxID=2683259 RepID=UPI001412716A|nr:Gp37 family protein [Pseudomonas sp. SLFW]NBB09340.1 hypothetical protein [Pseudomonas sp. SLFW]
MTPGSTQTQQLLNALTARLRDALGNELGVELFPEQPDTYRLNHAVGAVLVAYGKSTFSAPEATDAVFQARHLVFRLTVVVRQLNGNDGAVGYLDRIRECLSGWYPPHCDSACRPLHEHFIGQALGLWQYCLDIGVRATQLQAMTPAHGALLTRSDFEGQP